MLPGRKSKYQSHVLYWTPKGYTTQSPPRNPRAQYCLDELIPVVNRNSHTASAASGLLYPYALKATTDLPLPELGKEADEYFWPLHQEKAV